VVAVWHTFIKNRNCDSPAVSNRIMQNWRASEYPTQYSKPQASSHAGSA
jgi:hypothetical protein